MIGIRKEIKNQNQNLRPWLLASKPAIICGARRRAAAITNSGISNIKITILKFKIYRVKQVLRGLIEAQVLSAQTFGCILAPKKGSSTRRFKEVYPDLVIKTSLSYISRG